MTHYHIDHAGIVQEFKDKGAKLIVMENQRELSLEESRPFLGRLGIFGEIIPTPGHGSDHITLVLDEGITFTGGLPPESAAEEGSAA